MLKRIKDEKAHEGSKFAPRTKAKECVRESSDSIKSDAEDDHTSSQLEHIASELSEVDLIVIDDDNDDPIWRNKYDMFHPFQDLPSMCNCNSIDNSSHVLICR